MAITPQQLKQLEGRLSRRARPAMPVLETELRRATPAHQVILGVDPSLRGTGYGIIKLSSEGHRATAHGTIACSQSLQRSRCLMTIAQTLRAVLKEHAPTACVVEGLFYAQNFQTAMIMGEARGAALSVVAEAGLEVFEMAPRRVKQAIVGYGAARKLAVAKMVQRLLRLEKLPDPDAADALALALAYAQESGRYSLTPLKRI